jgi:hypothetical protein
MPEDAGEKDVPGRFPPRPPGVGSRDVPPPPPRPESSGLKPPPIQAKVPPPGAVVASRSIWIAGFVVGLLAVVIAFYARDGVLDALQERLGDLMPDESDDTLERVTAVVFWVSITAILLVTLIESLLLRRMMGRHGGIRWVMLVALLVHAGVALLADAFLGVGDAGIFLRLLIFGQLALSALGLLVSVLPGTGRWFRLEHEMRDGPAV